MNAVQDIPLAQIVRNPKQPRETFPQDHIDRLAASIRKRGLLQPVLLRPLAGGGPHCFQIVAGECRFRAYLQLKRETIAAIVEAADDRETQLRAIVENLQRRDMNPIEEARAFKTLLDSGYSVDQIVDELGLNSTAIVRQRLDLLDLNADIQRLVASGNLSVNMAWGVAQAPSQYQTRLLQDIGSGKLRTSDQVKHAGMALRDAAAQLDVFASLPRASARDAAALSRLESKIDSIAAMVQAGFRDGECIAAQRVAPDRVTTAADKLALIRKHVQQMEHDLRRVAMREQIRQETVPLLSRADTRRKTRNARTARKRTK